MHLKIKFLSSYPQISSHLNSILMYSRILCISSPSSIAMRLRASKVIIAHFCLVMECLSFVFFFVSFFSKILSTVFHVLMSTYIAVRQCHRDAGESKKAWKNPGHSRCQRSALDHVGNSTSQFPAKAVICGEYNKSD